MLGESANSWIHRKNTLQIDHRARTTVFDSADDFPTVVRDHLWRNVLCNVINADQNKDLGGRMTYDFVKSSQHTERDVAADTAIQDLVVARKFSPISAFRDAVAEEHHNTLNGFLRVE